MMQKDNNNAISEKLSQNDADVVTKRQAWRVSPEQRAQQPVVPSVRRGELAERILAALNPAPHGGHQWARVTDTREGGRLFTCDCGHQTRVSGPSATEIEALAREVIRCAK